MIWEPYQPTRSDPWDLKKVGHLFRRAAFGANHGELQRGLKDGPEVTIDRLLAGGPRDDDFEQTCAYMTREQSLPAGAPTRQLAAWWLYRMIRSPHPLREKITLFWHNHFATSNAKVENAQYMLGQYQTQYQYALSSFKDLLQAMTLDPAMMIWLDTVQSKKGKPNENYARELMELFSLGVGHYTETDIREAARAFTGYHIKSGKVIFMAKDHDAEAKTVFDNMGKWKAEDIVRLCLARSECAIFIVRKLYRFLISETDEPSDEMLSPLAAQYRESNYDTGRLVATMLRSRHFFSAGVYRQKVKSPVEYAVGIVRALEGNVGPLPLAEALEGLGQMLFAPPSVKGWDGGAAWLNAQTLLFRQNLALNITSTEDSRFGRRCDPAALVKKHNITHDKDCYEFLLTLLLQNDLQAATRDKLQDQYIKTRAMAVPPFWSRDDIADFRIRQLTHWLLALPEYQLC